MKDLYVVILAAGQGTRMKSKLPKVLHQAAGKTLLEHVTELAFKLKPKQVTVVVPKQHDSFKSLPSFSKNKVSFAVQAQQLGTGHAVRAAMSGIKSKRGQVLVLNGDMPLARLNSVRKLIQMQQKKKTAVSLLTAEVEDSFGYGRILRNGKGALIGIVEHKDATAAQKNIHEINVGVYCFELAFLQKSIGKIKNQNKQKEYYLPDLVAFAEAHGLAMQASCLSDSKEALGVNTQIDLNCVADYLYERKRKEAMQNGAVLVGTQVFIDSDVKIASGVHLESPCYLKGETKLKSDVIIETGCVLKDSEVGEGSLIKSHSYLDQARVADNCQIGPFAHLRPKTELKSGVKIGNFVETKKSTVGEGSKINHLSYIGDAEVGKSVNIGAGTITCNYDGVNKYKTKLGDHVFIGSDTQLVAPVTLGKHVFVGAGSTVTRDAAAHSLVLSRVPQQEIKGWARRKRQKK
jgi:bifunctional UDP-N-acetylglucosamine pyrophosphorylase / glucosamine-1-phosphate N-acetyltransferase